jgi:hypothetical protein
MPHVLVTYREFDYVKAWQNAALPAWRTLSEPIRDLYDHTIHHCDGVHQDHSTLCMPWINDNQRRRFDRFPDEDLAFAARIINCMGHWHPSGLPILVAEGREAGFLTEAGSHWKFSHYCDQLLRARLGMPETDRSIGHQRGWGWAVHEGGLRLTWASKNCWTWLEVCPATAHDMVEHGQRVREICNQSVSGVNRSHSSKRDWAAMEAIRRYRPDVQGTPLPLIALSHWPTGWHPLIDTGRHYADKTREEWRPA